MKSSFVQRDGRSWDEKIEIMTGDWEACGWVVVSISTLRTQSAYKVSIDYEKAQEGKAPDEFHETVWRSPQGDWKPTGSIYKPAEPRFIFISWWLREPTRKANDLDQSFKRKCGVSEGADSSSAAAGGDLAMDDDDPQAQGRGLASSSASDNSSESSVLISPPKRMRNEDSLA